MQKERLRVGLLKNTGYMQQPQTITQQITGTLQFT